MTFSSYLSISPCVVDALKRGVGVVALESTIITHGMPYPQNLETANLVESTVWKNGAVPATIAIMGGFIKIGLTNAELEFLAKEGGKATKVSRRDIANVLSSGGTGSTTVSATMICANLAGIRIFATGGIGGVHRGNDCDISADIVELARIPVLVVCAGAKSILDLPKTVELLETGGVNVMGFRTSEFPAFFSSRSSLSVTSRVESEHQVAKILHTHFRLCMQSGLVLACPTPCDFPQVESAITESLCDAKKLGITGKNITPFLLEQINVKTKGKSLHTNIQLVLNNAAIAARVAREYASIHTRVTPIISVIGGICIDTIAKPFDRTLVGQTGTSNPGKVSVSIGGVDFNIAKTIFQLSPGKVLLYTNHHVGESFDFVDSSNLAPAGQYTAVLNGDGSLCSSVIDMACPIEVSSKYKNPHTRVIVISANLLETFVQSVVQAAGSIPVWADCVSVCKCVRLRGMELDLVKANMDELAVLAGVHMPAALHTPAGLHTWIEESSLKLCAKTILVTCGKSGFVFLIFKHPAPIRNMRVYSDIQVKTSIHPTHTIVQYWAPPINNVVDCTGAGDCLFAATIWAHFDQQFSLPEAVIFGIRAARKTLMSPLAVSPEITAKNLIQNSSL